MSWSWTCSAGVETVHPQVEGAATLFPSQSEAESWLGETWRDLLEAGVDSVTLMEDGREVYGPMSLHPA